MSDRFAALGFRIATDADLDALVRIVLDEVEPVQRPDGGYTHVCGTTSRAALVVHTDAAGAVSCVTPFLSAETRTQARISGAASNGECVHCSVLLADMWGPAGAERIGFVTPHFLLWADALEPGTAVELGLAGVVETMARVAEGSPPFLAADDGRSRQGVAPVPMAQVCGTVRSHFLRHNELGGGVFEWATIDVGGVVLELAAATADLDVPFTTGATVAGRVLLSGPVWDVIEGR